jgi:hypothetical protein
MMEELLNKNGNTEKRVKETEGDMEFCRKIKRKEVSALLD